MPTKKKVLVSTEIDVIHVGDCVDVMTGMPDDFVDLTVTSPPYDNLRIYNGYNFDFEGIAKELFRVTKQGGVVVWVVGDATIKGSETGTSFKQALYFKEIGFNLHDTMIYYRESPPLTHNRYEQHFEYMFVFSKGKPKTFNPFKDRKKYIDHRTNKSFRREKDGSYSKGYCKGEETMKIRGNIWKINTGGGQSTTDKSASKHPAIFPERLAEDHILSWSDEGDTVLDPMCGSGTAPRMAKVNGRHYIGIDTSEEYVEIARKRCAKPAPPKIKGFFK